MAELDCVVWAGAGKWLWWCEAEVANGRFCVGNSEVLDHI